MERETFGKRLADLRKEKGMTQLELAEKMGVTDKAVSKWERNLSLPDAGSLPRLAEIFQVSVDELMQGKAEAKEKPNHNTAAQIVNLALKGVALAMGVAVAVLSALHEAETGAAVSMLGIGLACLAAAQLSKPER
ncbi:MAG TPA: helix-turn-helix transcriptional regulator [Candidatus Merdivicinus intestinigallinarum]|nr:helix-turn-helix transcriptional regulator [Candidatus Merdivicinus intestinigallinarum]